MFRNEIGEANASGKGQDHVKGDWSSLESLALSGLDRCADRLADMPVTGHILPLQRSKDLWKPMLSQPHVLYLCTSLRHCCLSVYPVT